MEENKPKPGSGWSWGVAGLIVSSVIALALALLVALPSLAGLGRDPAAGRGEAFAGLAAVLVGVLIFPGVLLILGLIFFIFFLGTGRKKAMFIAIGQIVLALALLALVLAFMAS
jgi:hypothetical protein